MYTSIEREILSAKLSKENFVNFMRKLVYGINGDSYHDSDGKLVIGKFTQEEIYKEITDIYQQELSETEKSLIEYEAKLYNLKTIGQSDEDTKKSYDEYVQEMKEIERTKNIAEESNLQVKEWSFQFQELKSVWESLEDPIDYEVYIRPYSEFYANQLEQTETMINFLKTDIERIKSNQVILLEKIDVFEKKVIVFLNS